LFVGCLVSSFEYHLTHPLAVAQPKDNKRLDASGHEVDKMMRDENVRIVLIVTGRISNIGEAFEL